jgi:hypothetical protein
LYIISVKPLLPTITGNIGPGRIEEKKTTES